MTEPQPKSKSSGREKTPAPTDAPFPIAEDSDGSTQPVPGGADASASPGPGGSGDGPDSGGSRLSASGTGGASGAGTSTGGFETMLGKIVVDRGLATREEVELCSQFQRESESTEEPETLADILVTNDFLTRRQLERLRSEFEAQKSTQQIPGYRIRHKVGAGAMATVFRARQISLDRPVAIKVLPKKFSDNEKFIERFYKEGRAAAQLNHPNIVAAYDVGKAGEHHYFVMEFVDGDTVYDRIVKSKRVPEKEAIRITQQVARALQHAHKKGFIHRDIKPKNIMITKGGVVKLADLGLARAVSDKDAAKAEAGRAYGTPYYISPEQIRGEVDIGPAADIYGLGATFYHMVTGKVPFDGKNPSAVMHKHLKDDLEPPDHLNPDLSPACAQVIEMMMAKKPADRYHSAADLLEDLDLISEGHPPHFARGHIGIDALSEVSTTTSTTMLEAPPAPVSLPTATTAPATSSTAFMILLVFAAISVILNVILLLVALA